MFVFLWEQSDGERKWEAVKKGQTAGFLKKLLDDGVHPATVMVAFSPILFHWVWKEYHKGLSDVYFQDINEEIYGTAPEAKTERKPLDIPVKKEPETKFGWIAPDGRFFGCNYGGHSSLADKIVGEIQYVANPEMHLEDLGWAKVLSGIRRDGKKYTIGMGRGKKLTDAQLKTLQREKLDDSYGISSLL